jgi:ammonia channel protein AmtB
LFVSLYSFSLCHLSTLITYSFLSFSCFYSFILFVGYGFNPGSALLLTEAESTGKVAALAAVNTSLAAASGAIGALVTNLYIEERKTGELSFDLTVAMNGTLAGLVAITAPCGTIETWASIVVGTIAGWIYLMGSKLLLKLRLDDAVDAIPVHMFNGMWGLIATGLFSSPGRLIDAFGTDERLGLFYSFGEGKVDGTLLLIQCMAMLFVIGWSMALMLPFFIWLNYMGWFRADSMEELVGLDMSYHGGAAKDSSDGETGDVKARNSRKSAMRRHGSADGPEKTDEENDGNEDWDTMTLPPPPEQARPKRSAAIGAVHADSNADGDSLASANSE